MAAYLDIILLAALAGFLIFRLLSVLGQAHDIDPASTKGRDKRLDAWAPRKPIQDLQGDTKTYAEALQNLKKQDLQFTEKEFLKGAQVAYEMVFKAQNQSDLKTLQPLVSKSLYQRFKERINAIQSRKLIIKDELIRIKSTEISAIDLTGKIANVTVEFVVEKVYEQRDQRNRLVNGDPDQIEVEKEFWTFARPIVSQNPNWQLVDVSESQS